jgi:hypothetical protein
MQKEWQSATKPLKKKKTFAGGTSSVEASSRVASSGVARRGAITGRGARSVKARSEVASRGATNSRVARSME